MSGRFGVLQTLVQGVAVNAKWTHCLIQREELASQQLSGFSAAAIIKSKYRNKIDIERDMCVAISNIAPRFNKICIQQQAHCSH